jgi:hypothetical protein
MAPIHWRAGKVWLVGLALYSWVPPLWAESPRPPRMSLWDKLWSSRSNNTWSPTDRRTTGTRGPIIISPLPPEVQAEALRAEQEAYLRRVAVCTELRRVAVERGDETLYRQADELEREAEALYRLRVGRLGIQLPRSQDNLTHNNTLRPAQEEQIRAAARRLSPPSPPTLATAEVRVREVKP